MLDKTFNPQEVEGRIYAQWLASGAFRATRDVVALCVLPDA